MSIRINSTVYWPLGFSPDQNGDTKKLRRTVHRDGYKRSRKVCCAHGWALRSWKLWTYHGDRHRQKRKALYWKKIM